MEVSNLVVGGPLLIALVWAGVTLAKKYLPLVIPNLNPDWYWVVACAEGCALTVLGSVAAGTSNGGLELALEQGLVLGVAAVGCHESGKRVPAVLQDIMNYLSVTSKTPPVDLQNAATPTTNVVTPEIPPTAPNPSPVGA